MHDVGLLLGFLALGISLGSAITSRLAGFWAVGRLLFAANSLALTSATSFLLVAFLGKENVASVAGLEFLYALGAGMASPIALTRAISVDTSITGSAAGLAGFIQMAVGAACIWLVGTFADPALSAGIIVTVTSAFAQVAFRLAMRSDFGRRTG
ncbi:hypothetical protein [Paraburkholderia sp. MM5477-R1]|uniref:hypothetical protein n=1 Tax=Paraburkholderia sp. MM5477-R1 TaxID=2991062 RepID=UPI003D1C03A9